MGVKTAFKIKTINRVVGIEIEMIQPNKNQPRKLFLQKELESLALSIKENGLLQPITVRKIEKDYYELISGERRLRATKLAGMNVIPCIVINSTQKESAVFALLENLQRSDLNYFEEAVAIKGLMVECGLSQAELGTKLGYAQPTIANKLRLLRYDDMSQKLMIGKDINERQARALLKIEDENKLYEAIDYIHLNKLNSTQTEKYVEAINNSTNTCKKTFHPIIKDVRLFFNTINNAIKIMNQSGINASAQKIDTGDYIEYVVKIPINR